MTTPTSSTPERVDVAVELTADVTTPGRIALCLAVADHLGATDEEFDVSGPDGPVEPVPVAFPHGTRVHLVDVPEGRMTVSYTAKVGRGTASVGDAVTEADRLLYVLPSRYCPSDRLAGWAAGEFGTSDDDATRVARVTDWVHERTAYVPGSTGPGDDALVPLHTGRGVCRDYAHLVVTILRGLEIPARYVSVYAPGLSPMDAHAVVEVALGGSWSVVDATRLAPRPSLVRCATGRDACDVAFMTTLGAETDMPTLRVLATAQPDLPTDDGTDRVRLR